MEWLSLCIQNFEATKTEIQRFYSETSQSAEILLCIYNVDSKVVFIAENFSLGHYPIICNHK